MRNVIERLLNLLAFLLTVGRPVSADEIRRRVAGYDGSGDEAFRRMFERDKDLLRNIGIPLEFTESDGWGFEHGYAIDPDNYRLPDPGLTDEELPAILKAAAEHGAQRAGYMVVRLPGAVEKLFPAWLARTFPDRAEKVMNRLGAHRGGKVNDKRFGHRMHTTGPWAKVLKQLFRTACAQHGFNRRFPPFATHHFRHLRGGQMDLF